MNKTVAIIQARIDSKRLPGKVLLPLWKDKTVLEIVVARVSAAETIDEVVIATTVKKSDLLIVDNYKNRIARVYPNIKLYRGSEHDVLNRVYEAAMSFDATTIVDITADCPLVDPRHIDKLVKEFRKNNIDYISNVVERTWPDGLDIQVYTLKALYYLMRKNTRSLDNINTLNHDHAGWNIVKDGGYRVLNVEAPNKYKHPEWGLTLDEIRDYKVLKYLFEKFVKEENILFPVEDILDFLIVNPDILKYNEMVKRKKV